MKVEILKTAPYSDFSTMPKLGAKVLEKGEIADFPEYYARGIIAAGLAKTRPAKAELAKAKLAEEVETPDVTSAAQELALEHEIDLATIEGTGKGGRIVKSDVQGVIDNMQLEER